MPKRGRSENDEEHLGCLVKNHISQKEVNSGVLQEQNMQAVFNKTLDKLKQGAIYNKTREKLFNGVKNLANNNVNNSEESRLEKDVESHDKVRYTQLCLTNSGTFTKLPLPQSSGHATPGDENWEFCSCVHAGCRVPPGQKCSSCWRPLGDSCRKTCSSCAAATCSLCDQVRSCGGCWRMFCGNCAVADGALSCVCYNCKR